jgi:hypothetical protein
MRDFDAAEESDGEWSARSVPARLDQIIAQDHALVRLARTIDWSFLERILRRGLHRRG